jgi:hypothetical protein
VGFLLKNTVLVADYIIFHSLMTETIDRPHPQPLSQFGRGEKDVDRENMKIGISHQNNFVSFTQRDRGFAQHCALRSQHLKHNIRWWKVKINGGNYTELSSEKFYG